MARSGPVQRPFTHGIGLEHYPKKSIQPAPPPGRPRNRMIWAAGWGSGLAPTLTRTDNALAGKIGKLAKGSFPNFGPLKAIADL